MSALKIENTLNEIERSMAALAPYRKPALFNEFLVKGYTAITLSSVPERKFSEILQAKLCLGTLITLYDDFADRPTQSNTQLLETLYKLNFTNSNSVGPVNLCDRPVFDFASSLFLEIQNILNRQQHHRHLIEILNFDLKQFYSANQYSSVLTDHPYINNPLENRLYAHHNMGMVMVAMMDLMATEKVKFSEFGPMREVFLMGQRMGRIFNVLTTYNREMIDGDITGELSTYSAEHEIQTAVKILSQEIRDLHVRIAALNTRITTFSVTAYLEGLMRVQTLHEKMKGII